MLEDQPVELLRKVEIDGAERILAAQIVRPSPKASVAKMMTM
jgi:hypothetical protein